MELKKITAIIRSDQLEALENRFKGPDLPGITVDHVQGYGEYANFFAKDWMSRYARVEIVADERQSRRIIDVITEVAHTGTRGDGIVYVVPVEQLQRIRDRHTARSTQTCPRLSGECSPAASCTCDVADAHRPVQERCRSRGAVKR